MTAADLPRVLEIENRSFDVPWTNDQFLAAVGGKGRLLEPVLESAAPDRPWKVEAYASAWVVATEMQINNLAVSPGCRRNGYGRRILEHLLTEAVRLGCVEVTLEVREDNRAAIGLYVTAGFHRTGVRRGYYRKSGVDAWILTRNVGDRL